MKEILEKLSSYNIFNYLFPGVLFAVIGEQVSTFTLLHDDLIVGAFVYYFFGLVISRVGSLLLEPMLKKSGFLEFADYKEFVQACKADEKIELLSEVNNMYRTLSSGFIIILMLVITLTIEEAKFSYASVTPFAAVLLMLALFLFSYRKQTDYIRTRVSVVLSEVSGKL